MFKFLLLISFFAVLYASDTPIIGILAQETFIVSKYLPKEDEFDSFIAASYVKYLESSGARVLPVWIGQDTAYYERVVNYTNGILFPGGGTYFNETDGYGEAAKTLYRLALQANDRGIHYPIWGTCLGMEVLMYAALGEDIRIKCSSEGSKPLDFKSDFGNSKLFSKAPPDIVKSLGSKNITYNHHKLCLTESVLKEYNLLDDWLITSTTKDENNLEFISSMESKKYPVYGVQFHSEKNCFEFNTKYDFPHSMEAVKSAQYFANFFIEECRKNDNKFPTSDMDKKALIYNFSPTYTGNATKSSYYEQLYFFRKNDPKYLLKERLIESKCTRTWTLGACFKSCPILRSLWVFWQNIRY